MRSEIKHPVGIKNILKEVIKKIEKKGPGKKDKILKAWKKNVEEKALCHTMPVSIRRKILTIDVDSSAWLYTLNLQKEQILKGIKKDLPGYKIEGIRFRMGEL